MALKVNLILLFGIQAIGTVQAQAIEDCEPKDVQKYIAAKVKREEEVQYVSAVKQLKFHATVDSKSNSYSTTNAYYTYQMEQTLPGEKPSWRTMWGIAVFRHHDCKELRFEEFDVSEVPLPNEKKAKSIYPGPIKAEK